MVTDFNNFCPQPQKNNTNLVLLLMTITHIKVETFQKCNVLNTIFIHSVLLTGYQSNNYFLRRHHRMVIKIKRLKFSWKKTKNVWRKHENNLMDISILLLYACKSKDHIFVQLGNIYFFLFLYCSKSVSDVSKPQKTNKRTLTLFIKPL